jgi:hypothetical protein
MTVPLNPAPVAQFTFPGQPRFDLSADGGGPTQLGAGSSIVSRSRGGPVTVAHRYFYDAAAHTYFGYDLVIQPDHDEFYKVAFYDLSIGPLDFQTGPPDTLNPALWKKLQIPALPSPSVIEAGDALLIAVFSDPASHRSYTDTMTIASMADITRQFPPNMQRMVTQIQLAPMLNRRVGGSRSIPTVSGAARDFSSADADLHLQQASITVNDISAGMPRNSAAGALVWVYVPKHGRYILSAVPHPELGFAKAGELRGGVADFTISGDKVKIESPIPIAPGDSAYVLYVLHDGDWAPTSQSQAASVLAGSVSSLELAALKK